MELESKGRPSEIVEAGSVLVALLHGSVRTQSSGQNGYEILAYPSLSSS